MSREGNREGLGHMGHQDTVGSLTNASNFLKVATKDLARVHRDRNDTRFTVMETGAYVGGAGRTRTRGA
jgi:hypothetical protein